MQHHQPGNSSRVEQLRRGRGWPQEQLANISGVSVRTIQRLENGENVSFATLKAVAAAFDLDIRDLTEEPPSSVGQASPPEDKEPKKANVLFMRRITSGNELCGMIGHAHAYRVQNDELDTAQEVELVGNFLQDVQDIGDCWDGMEPIQKVEQGYRFTHMISELEEHGLWVFAARTNTQYHPVIAEIQVFSMIVVNVLVLRRTNPTIIKNHRQTR
jgi:transcriptional regulator with XRE-family HTH domain